MLQWTYLGKCCSQRFCITHSQILTLLEIILRKMCPRVELPIRKVRFMKGILNSGVFRHDQWGNKISFWEFPNSRCFILSVTELEIENAIFKIQYYHKKKKNPIDRILIFSNALFLIFEVVNMTKSQKYWFRLNNFLCYLNSTSSLPIKLLKSRSKSSNFVLIISQLHFPWSLGGIW